MKKNVTKIAAATLLLVLSLGITAFAAAKPTLYGIAQGDAKKGYSLVDTTKQSEGGLAYAELINKKNGFNITFEYRLGKNVDCMWACFTPDKGGLGMMGLQRDNRPQNILDAAVAFNGNQVLYEQKTYTSVVETASVSQQDDSKWRTAKIVYLDGELTTYINNKKVLTSKKLNLADKVYLTIAGTTNSNAREYGSIEVRNIAINKYYLNLSDDLLVMDIGNTMSLSYSVCDEYKKASASWKSSNTGIAKVSSKGQVKAVGTGVCKITCNVKGLKKTATVVVKPKQVTNVAVAGKTKNSVQLKWKQQTGVAKYAIYMYDPDFEEYTLVKTIAGKYNMATIDKLKKNTSYKFKISAYVTNGSKKYYGKTSKVITVKTNK